MAGLSGGAPLATLAFQAVLVFARIGAAAMLLPGLGEQEVPAMPRLALGLALVPLLLPGLAPALPPAPEAPAETLRLLALEALAGLFLGGLARLVALALGMAGQAVALLLGLATVLAPDPQFGAQGTAPARLLLLAGAVLVLGSGLYALPLRALAESYAVLPPGAPWPAGEAAELAAQAASDSLALALRLAAPFVLAAVLFHLALALLARLAPQVQIFFVATPGQLLLGLALFALLFPAMMDAFAEAAAAAFAALAGRG
ncbi:flagellar biosynthetic protein FliR [Caldovatus aquaticus]|uniref:Flagellar biosynthetic protein FliR n=1 Tax=Caldovatus aquaticus TaxID=2865671 RepID=A0ABS7F2K6_9PROT|nr:flagellar biosynthetic protein FliR [Caldovatus aquaticus]MBW8269836.1 flagellar biosynthetic protein FliR [Caldovatus aquaticus]